MRRPILLAAVAAAALTLTACAAPIEGEVPVSKLRVTDAPGRLAFFDQQVGWKDCSAPHADRDQCAVVSAPLDWSDPEGRTIQLALVRHRATGTRLGSLVVDPGGPGASGGDLVYGDVTQAVTAEVAEHYDVVGIDPRGVGESTAVRCGGGPELDRLLYSALPGAIGSKRWIAADLARSRRFAHACRAHSGSLLGHIDTVAAAHDLELVRGILGDRRLNYVGYSYGSYLGTVYAGLYPTHVGRLVLDGIDDPWEDEESGHADDGPSESAEQAGGFDDALVAYLRACLAGAPGTGSHCPFSGGLPAAKAVVEADLRAAAAHPLRAADGRTLNDQVLSTGIIEAMYDPTEWPRLTALFTQVAAGDPAEAFRLADEYNGRGHHGRYDDNSTEASMAIGCLESGSGYDLRADAHELRTLEHDDPMLGRYFAYSDLECAGWNRDPAPWPAPIHAAASGPILLVGTTDDPATPYSGAIALRRQLDHAQLVSYHGEGHTAYDLSHRCVDSAVDAYLLHGTVPQHDPQCR